MSKQETIDKYWLEFIGWSHNTALNQVGHGQFTYPRNDLFMDPTEENFWVWYVRQTPHTPVKPNPSRPSKEE